MHGANWVLGDGYNQIYKNIKVRFDSIGIASVDSMPGYIPFLHTSASMSDSSGNLLFTSNGIKIYDKLGAIIPNSLLHPGPIVNQYTASGLNLPRAAAFLPFPGDSIRYILIHIAPEIQLSMGSPGYIPYPIPAHIYYTVINKTLNNGNGGIESINNIILTDTLTHAMGCGAITKHANGRDWWIIHKKHYRNEFYKFLVTPYGVSYYGSQTIGPDFTDQIGVSYIFSPNGEFMAGVRVGVQSIGIMRFDRCTGLLSDFTNVPIQSGSLTPEILLFSKNSRYIYTNTDKIFQFDLIQFPIASSVQNSKVVVGFGDSTFVCPPSFQSGTGYSYGQLAPNGKIYYPTWTACSFLSTIESPDSGGINCNVQNHNVNIYNPAYTTPYLLNYTLSTIPGSICDSLTVGQAEVMASDFSLYPNPSTGNFNIRISKPEQQVYVQVFTLEGRLILAEMFHNTNNLSVQLPENLKDGLYLVQLQTEKNTICKKFVKQRID